VEIAVLKVRAFTRRALHSVDRDPLGRAYQPRGEILLADRLGRILLRHFGGDRLAGQRRDHGREGRGVLARAGSLATMIGSGAPLARGVPNWASWRSPSRNWPAVGAL